MASSPPPIPHDSTLDFDLDSFFDSIPPDLPFELLDDLPPIDGESCLLSASESPEASDPSWVDEIERFLMRDDDVAEGDPDIGDFLSISDILADGSEGDGSAKSSEVDSDVATPETVAEEARNDLVEGRSEEEEEDAAAKKRRRQLRNRDSAMKSREKRKLYVQDLEKKSRFLESECRRLHHLLQCCASENAKLHHRLNENRLHGVPGARQESAVLFKESLLLGSLFWLVNIVFLFLAPYLLFVLNLGCAAATERARDLGLQQNQESVEAKKLGKRLTFELFLEVVFYRRRFKAFRRKMKFSPFF